MSNYSEILDEIIDDAYEGEVSWTHDQLDVTSVLDDILKDIDERKAETRQALLDWHNKQVERAYSDGFQKASKGAFKSQQEAKRTAVEQVLDRLGQSFDTHTTPYERDLLTRSYVRDTLNFERNKLKEEV